MKIDLTRQSLRSGNLQCQSLTKVVRVSASAGFGRVVASGRALSVAGFLFATAVHGQTVDLHQAYLAAFSNDALFRAATAARDAGAEEKNIGLARLLPEISAEYATSRTSSLLNSREVRSGYGGATSASASSLDRNRTTSLDGDRQVSNSSIAQSASALSHFDTRTDEIIGERSRLRTTTHGLQLRQPLINFGAMAAYRQGLALTGSSEALFKAQQQELMVRVSTAYAEVLFAIENVKLARSRLENLTVQLAANERMLEGGQGTITDVLETRSKREIARTQMIEAEDAEAVAKVFLTSLIGRPVVTLAPLSTSMATGPQMDEGLDVWRLRAKNNSGLLKTLEYQMEVAHQELEKIKAGHLPRLDLVVGISQTSLGSRPVTATTSSESSRRNTAQSENTSSTTTSGNGSSSLTESLQASSSEINESQSAINQNSVEAGRFVSRASDRRIGLELNIPLFAGGGISARARQAAAIYVQASAELDKKQEDIYFEIERQHRFVQSYHQKSLALSDAVESTRFTLEATMKSMMGGIRTNLDVLNAQEQLVTMQRELANTKYSYLISYLQLRFHSGVLTEEELSLVGGLRH